MQLVLTERARVSVACALLCPLQDLLAAESEEAGVRGGARNEPRSAGPPLPRRRRGLDVIEPDSAVRLIWCWTVRRRVGSRVVRKGSRAAASGCVEAMHRTWLLGR